MTYVEGFLTPVAIDRRDAYRDHAEQAATLLKEFGVVRMVECWGDDVPHGTRTDLWRAVDAREGETVVFSWFEYPDKPTREAASTRIMDDPRMAEMMKDMPFDGRRMVWGGFDSVHDAGTGAGTGPATGPATGYVDGVVLPLRAGGHDAYRDFAAATAGLFLDNGALRVMDAVGDDVQPGKATDFLRAVQVEEGESVGFGWVEWPDRPTRDAGWEKIMADPRMQDREPPFDGKRMIFGGFAVLLDR